MSRKAKKPKPAIPTATPESMADLKFSTLIIYKGGLVETPQDYIQISRESIKYVKSKQQTIFGESWSAVCGLLIVVY
jgi:hypothetical protein